MEKIRFINYSGVHHNDNEGMWEFWIVTRVIHNGILHHCQQQISWVYDIAIKTPEALIQWKRYVEHKLFSHNKESPPEP